DRGGECEPLAIGAEGGGERTAALARQGAHQTARRRVPDCHLTPDRDPDLNLHLLLHRHGHRYRVLFLHLPPTSEHLSGAHLGPEFLPRYHPFLFAHLVTNLTESGETAPVRAEHQAADLILVSAQGAHLLAGASVNEQHHPRLGAHAIVRDGGGTSPRRREWGLAHDGRRLDSLR